MGAPCHWRSRIVNDLGEWKREERRGGSFSRTPVVVLANSSAHYIHENLFYCGSKLPPVLHPDREAARGGQMSGGTE